MPNTLTAYEFLIWFCVGLGTGLGWHLGAWIVGRITR